MSPETQPPRPAQTPVSAGQAPKPEATLAPNQAPKTEPKPEPKKKKKVDTSEADEEAQRLRRERRLIRQTLAKRTELAKAPVDHREATAKILGVKDDPEAMVLAALTGDGSATADVTEVLDLAGSDPMELGVVCMGMERAEMRRFWAVLGAVGAGDGNLPQADQKAAMALGRTLAELNSEAKSTLEAVLKLAAP